MWSATTLRTSGRLCRAQQCWDPHVAQPDASERGLSPVNPPHGPPLSTSGLSSAFPVHEAWVPVAAAPSFPEEGADPRCWSPPLHQGTPNACGNWEGRCGENFRVAETDQLFPLDNREGLTETEMKQEGQPHRRSSLPEPWQFQKEPLIANRILNEKSNLISPNHSHKHHGLSNPFPHHPHLSKAFAISSVLVFHHHILKLHKLP